MEDLKQIRAVLRGLGIRIESIDLLIFNADGSQGPVSSDTDSVSVVLTFHKQTVNKTYTIEQLRSGLVTDARTASAALQEPDNKPGGVISRLLPGRRR